MATILFFLILAISILVLSILFFLSRLKPYCECEICKGYLNSTWSLEFKNLCDWYSYLLKKSPSGTIHVHVLGNVITANPNNVEYMLKTNFDNFPKGKQFSTILGDLLGRGIFAVDGEMWKFQRKMACLELGSVSIRSYAFDIVSDEIRNRLIPLLKSNIHTVLDLQDVLRRFSFDSICKFSFGMDPGCLKLSLPDSDLQESFDLASKLSAERAMTVSPLVWKIKRGLNIGSEKKLKEAIKKVDILAEQVIIQKRKHDFSSQNDLLSRFMRNMDDDKLLRDIIVSFLLAGRDTVASGLTTFFWLLAQHPRVIDEIRAESSRVMVRREKETLASFDEIREMHYLTAAIHESIRLFPPVQFDSKFCQEDDTLPDGTFVAKGTRVTYHPYAMGRMEGIWGKDCLEFKPERWLEDGVFKAQCPFKYPVFQGGVRVCLGKDLSIVEMKSVALALIRQFDFQVHVATKEKAPKFMPGLTATVRGGLPIMVQERREQ
ncbi:hypothetical protein KY285_028210 [Solanum tuberosum]|nr:hypothetical protein KY285_028210 [Solanum tuberosum]